MKILIKVTAEVLERSKMCGIDPDKDNFTKNCMLADAFSDLFKYSWVGLSYVYLLGGDGPHNPDRVLLPEWVVGKRMEFDNSYPEQRALMTPFSFEIEVPEYVIEKIGLSQIYKVLSESNSLELVMQDIG